MAVRTLHHIGPDAGFECSFRMDPRVRLFALTNEEQFLRSGKRIESREGSLLFFRCHLMDSCNLQASYNFRFIRRSRNSPFNEGLDGPSRSTLETSSIRCNVNTHMCVLVLQSAAKYSSDSLTLNWPLLCMGMDPCPRSVDLTYIALLFSLDK